jgi:hypothetical protein
VLRVRFTPQDLTRVRLLSNADPLWEIVLSSFLLHERHRPPFLSPWIRRIKADSAQWERIRPGARMLAGLAPQGPYFPDFLTPAEASDGLEAGLHAVACTSRSRLSSELGLLATACGLRRRTVPNWVRQFATGDRTTMSRFHPGLDVVAGNVSG